MTEKGVELEILFPEKIVHGVKVTPLSLKDMPKVVDAFGKIIQLAESGSAPSEVAVNGLRELLLILPYCIDRPPGEIPASIVPELIEVVLEQNATGDVVGKWKSLLARVSETMQTNQQAPQKSVA